MVKRIAAIGFVYLIAVLGWFFLGGTIVYRTENQDTRLQQEVGQLWGTPLEQKAPWGSLSVERKAPVEKIEGKKKKVIEQVVGMDKYDVPIVQNDIKVGFELDQRQKGLLWYSTYRVRFEANYLFENIQDKSGELNLHFAFPAINGIYDDFKFEVDGVQVPFTRQDTSLLVAKVPCAAKSRHQLAVRYSSQGLDRFIYRFGDGITEVRNFQLVAATDFPKYDHPVDTLSPNVPKERTENGWRLTWRYSDLISGNGIGIEMPQKINPGPMAARISFFAPVSLGFFFFLIFVISMLRGIEIHPMNYFFLAAAFFAFHLLLAYLVDHISIHLAFMICSAVSIFLVISYMRLVVNSRFAFMEAGLSQFIYLIGFSYAFFIEGFTGLAVTIGAIITLFVVMQMTANIKWAEKFKPALRDAGSAITIQPREPIQPSSSISNG